MTRLGNLIQPRYVLALGFAFSIFAVYAATQNTPRKSRLKQDTALTAVSIQGRQHSGDPTPRESAASGEVHNCVEAIPIVGDSDSKSVIQLCQACSPGEPHFRCGVDCQSSSGCRETGWDASRPIPWQALTQGEYIGPPRAPHVQVYQVRVADELEFIYRRKREQSNSEYRLNVGDRIRVESVTEENLARDVEILIDGKITLPPAFQIVAAGRTIQELTEELEEKYKELYRVPAITVTPIETERRLQDLLEAVDSRAGTGGLRQVAKVSPEGTVQLPGIGNVSVQGLAMDEVQQEIEARYASVVLGIGVTPKLTRIAPHFIYVGGEVRNPSRYEITTPTSAVMAIVSAGGWNFGGNLREIVIFRRTDDWRLIATKINLRDALLGKAPCPHGEIWLRDSDIVYVPKGKLLLKSDFVDLLFTKGIYRIFPIDGSISASTTL